MITVTGVVSGSRVIVTVVVGVSRVITVTVVVGVTFFCGHFRWFEPADSTTGAMIFSGSCHHGG
jgi:hypothetical protein